MSGRATTVEHIVRAVVQAAGFAQRSDSELIADFLKGDAAAFESLVRRHGPMVLQACRQVTRCEADAEDAFQATFVLLHRKAGTIRQTTVAGWLFRVARRAAGTARRATERRDRRESVVARPELSFGTDPSWREAIAILHEELDRLPEAQRLPLILCYLQGLSRDEAAQRLGWTIDTLRGRLDRSRTLLRTRLQKRGIALSAGLLAALLPEVIPAKLIAGVVAPSVRVAAVVQALSSVGRAWTLGGGLSVATGLLVGVVVLAAGAGAPPVEPPMPPKEKAAPPAVVHKDSPRDPLPDGAVGRLGTLRFNHGDGLTTLRYLPDGKTILSLGNGIARIWDAETGVELRSFKVNKGSWDDQIAISADGKAFTLLQQEFKGDTIRRYDMGSGKQLESGGLPTSRGEISVYRRNAISADGKLAIVNTPKGHMLCTVSGKGVEKYFLDKSGMNSPALAFAGVDYLVRAEVGSSSVLEARTGKVLRTFVCDGPAKTITCSPDGKLLATLAHHVDSPDGFLDKDTVQIWDLTAGKRLHSLAAKPKSWYMGLVFSADGRMLVTSTANRSGSYVTLWDTQTGKQTHEIADFGDILALSPDGKRLVIGSQRGLFSLWDTITGERLSSDAPLHSYAPALYLSANGHRAFTLGNTTIAEWDVKTGSRLHSFETSPQTNYNPAAAISPDGRRALTISRALDKSWLHVWDIEAHREVRKMLLEGEFPATTFAFTPDSKRFALLRPGDPRATVTIYEVDSGKEISSFVDPNRRWSFHLYFTEAGKTVVVVSTRIAAFAVADGKMLFNYRVEPVDSSTPRGAPILGVETTESTGWLTGTFTLAGDLAACVLKGPTAGFGGTPVENRLAILDGHTGKIIRRWHDSGGHGAVKLAFSPDGRLLATSDAYDIHLWETSTGKEVRTFRGHRNEIEALAFSGNGRRLASSSSDSTVLIWGLEPPKKTESADWWKELSSADAAIAYGAIWQLSDAPDAVALPILRKNLHPATAGELERMLESIADLDHNQFRVRDAAQKYLSDLGTVARPMLQRAMTRKPSAEKATRIERLLAKVVGPPSEGESLRTWRALAVLEAKGTPGAKALLRELASGVPDAWLTLEARAALGR